MDISRNYFNKSLFLIIPLVGIIIVGIFLISYGITDPGQSFKMVLHSILMTAGLWLGCMIIVTYLWKKYPWETFPLKHLLLEIVLILSYTVLFSTLLYLPERTFWDLPENENIGMGVFVTILITLFITSVHESVFFYRQWKYNFSKSVRLEKDNLEAKFEALKAQVNPHFLFNSLNGLTTMVEDNKTAVEYIQNLSGLLRYMLKSGDRELVSLAEELEITKSYIKLQKARFGDSLDVNITIAPGTDSLLLPPLALQLLVENCIKHNILSAGKPLVIGINASDESVSVTNNLQLKSQVQSTGQGLKNITGRYSCFTPREVEIRQTSETFSVSLPLLRPEV
jgi:sensor histidine kinase YesM